MAFTDYREIKAWQKSMDLVSSIYRVTKLLPPEENYCLSLQMRRSAVSVPSNIAEGYGRNTKNEFCHFLSIAKGSNTELQTQLQMCINLGYLTEEQTKEMFVLSEEINRILFALISKLK